MFLQHTTTKNIGPISEIPEFVVNIKQIQGDTFHTLKVSCLIHHYRHSELNTMGQIL